jgi:hypothetical protein
MQITPDDIVDLINEAGQSLILEIPNRTPLPIDTRFGAATTRPSTNREVRGYLYSPKINQIPLTGTSAKSGEVIAIVFARGIVPEDFTPGCILIGNGKRYRVALGMELRHRATLLAYELKLTPEQVPNASH